MIKGFLKKYTPPGSGLEQTVMYYLMVGIGLNVFLSCVDWAKFGFHIYRLKTAIEPQLLMETYALPFKDFFYNLFFGFGVFALCSLLFILLSLKYLTGESKVLYLLKRLPDRKEMFREILGLGMISFGLFTVLMIVCMALYYTLFTLIAVKGLGWPV